MQIVNNFNLFILFFCVLSVKADPGVNKKLKLIGADYMVECDIDNVFSRKRLNVAATAGCIRVMTAEWCKNKIGCRKISDWIDPKRYSSDESNTSGKQFYSTGVLGKQSSGKLDEDFCSMIFSHLFGDLRL